MILWSKISSFILMNKVSQLSFLYRCHQTLCDQSEAGWGSVRDGMERRRSCQTHFSLHLRGNRVAHCPRYGICFQKSKCITEGLLDQGNTFLSYMAGMDYISNARQFLYLEGDAASDLRSYMQKAGDSWDISPQIFLDFPQNFRLRTRNQYCTQAIA